MSCGRKKGHKPKSDVNANGGIMDSGLHSELSKAKDNSEENGMDDFDISASDNRGKQSFSSPYQNSVNSQSSGRKPQRQRQRKTQVELNKSTGDPDDLHDFIQSKQTKNLDTDWNESNVTDMDFVDSTVKGVNLDDSDIFSRGTDLFKASTPCLRISQRPKRARKWADDFVFEKAVCSKSKRPRLSASEKILDSTLETSDHQTNVSVVSLSIKQTRSRRKKCGLLTDHEDLGDSHEQEPSNNLSLGISGTGSILSEGKEREEVKRKNKRGRPPKTLSSEQKLSLDESSLLDSEKNSKKKFTCFHCEEDKKNATSLRAHMASKHHRIWTSACPEGKLDEYGSFKTSKSIRCLKCEKLCQTFVSYKIHVKWCGREKERVDCEVCGKNIRAMSYDAHFRYMHKHKAEVVKSDELASVAVALPHAELFSKTGRSLRRAAVKARNQLLELTTDLVSTSSSSASYSKPQYICPDETFPADFMKKLQNKMKKLHRLTCCYQGCTSQHSEVSELVGHLLMCSCRPNYVCNPEEFTCLACGDSFKLKSEIVHHLTKHALTTTQDLSSSESEAVIFSSTDESSSSSDDDDDDDDDDDEGDDGASDASDLSRGAKRSKRKNTSKMTMETFLQEHCWSNLYPHWEAKQCLYKALPASEENRFLPQNLGLAVKIQTSETEFSDTVKLGLFETNLYNESYNIYVGGPIWALAWSPVPAGDHADQYLAIYAHRTSDETHSVNECSNETALIQFWRFQLLDQKLPESELPELIGGLLLDCGPIWEMKWCPTGCWNEESPASSQDLSRIGLLAVASHSGDVHILSIPKRFSVSSEPQHVKLYRATPVATLKRRGRDRICPCLCLDWHWKEKCGMLMAGFADGTTCLWDLNIASSLLRQKAADGRDRLFPFQSIRSHVWPVKGVAFCQSQLNLIVTCSADRLVKLWDLSEPESPLASYHNTLNTGVIWPVNCASTFACSGDECYLCEHNGTILCSYANNRIQTRPLTIHNASVWGMSYSGWSHCLVSCDSLGVVVRVPWIAPNHKSISECRQVLFVAEMRDGSAEVANCQMPLSLDVKTEATENDITTTDSNGCHQVSEAARQSSTDTCECSCHSNQTAESCENSKSHLVTDCKHCQMQRCLLFKDFSKEWQFSMTPLFYAKQLPADNILNSLPCSLNRVAWNTNYGFHKWLAVGGQAGILRVKLIEDFEQDQRKPEQRKPRKKIRKKR